MRFSVASSLDTMSALLIGDMKESSAIVARDDERIHVVGDELDTVVSFRQCRRGLGSFRQSAPLVALVLRVVVEGELVQYDL